MTKEEFNNLKCGDKLVLTGANNLATVIDGDAWYILAVVERIESDMVLELPKDHPERVYIRLDKPQDKMRFRYITVKDISGIHLMNKYGASTS